MKLSRSLASHDAQGGEVSTTRPLALLQSSLPSITLMYEFWLVRRVFAFLDNPRPSIERMAGDQSEDKPAQDQRAEREDRIAEHSHPAEARQHGGMEEF
jgi:hypothetical protein